MWFLTNKPNLWGLGLNLLVRKILRTGGEGGGRRKDGVSEEMEEVKEVEEK